MTQALRLWFLVLFCRGPLDTIAGVMGLEKVQKAGMMMRHGPASSTLEPTAPLRGGSAPN